MGLTSYIARSLGVTERHARRLRAAGDSRIEPVRRDLLETVRRDSLCRSIERRVSAITWEVMAVRRMLESPGLPQEHVATIQKQAEIIAQAIASIRFALREP